MQSHSVKTIPVGLREWRCCQNEPCLTSFKLHDDDRQKYCSSHCARQALTRRKNRRKRDDEIEIRNFKLRNREYRRLKKLEKRSAIQ